MALSMESWDGVDGKGEDLSAQLRALPSALEENSYISEGCLLLIQRPLSFLTVRTFPLCSLPVDHQHESLSDVPTLDWNSEKGRMTLNLLHALLSGGARLLQLLTIPDTATLQPQPKRSSESHAASFAFH